MIVTETIVSMPCSLMRQNSSAALTCPSIPPQKDYILSPLGLLEWRVGLLEWRAPFFSSVFEGLCPSFFFWGGALFFWRAVFSLRPSSALHFFFCVWAPFFFLKGCFIHFAHRAWRAFLFCLKNALFFLRPSTALFYFFFEAPFFFWRAFFFLRPSTPLLFFFFKAPFFFWRAFFLGALFLPFVFFYFALLST